MMEKEILKARIEENEASLRMLKLYGNGRNRGFILTRLWRLREQLEKLENHGES